MSYHVSSRPSAVQALAAGVMLFLAFGLFLAPHAAYAKLVPGGGGGGVIGDPSETCIPEAKTWSIEEALGIPTLGPFDPANGLQFIGWLFFAIMALVAVLALVMIVIGGIQYIYSAGSGGVTAAKTRISNALLGLILAMASILILYTINPELTQLRLPEMKLDGTIVADGQRNTKPDCEEGAGGGGNPDGGTAPNISSCLADATTCPALHACAINAGYTLVPAGFAQDPSSAEVVCQSDCAAQGLKSLAALSTTNPPCVPLTFYCFCGS